jgi:hypothetical protein
MNLEVALVSQNPQDSTDCELNTFLKWRFFHIDFNKIKMIIAFFIFYFKVFAEFEVYTEPVEVLLRTLKIFSIISKKILAHFAFKTTIIINFNKVIQTYFTPNEKLLITK